MSSFSRKVSKTIEINFDFLMALICGAVARFIWPSDPKWWGFGLLSIILWLACVSMVLSAVRKIVKLYLHERSMAQFKAQGHKPKSSELVSEQHLRQKGLIDD